MGVVFKRGSLIQEQDIPRLLDYRKKIIFKWEENAGELHEEDARQ